ncbi:MAG: S-methyl-5-thioribose-1-phosphate isomerase [Gammaproteobacteria bacterium]|nr:MAG: S-methyl-5-thioribose-1-phosphate isomerase [Gammaproteobacteria bacterium]
MPEAALDSVRYDQIRPIKWENDQLHLIDQRLLPSELRYVSYSHVREVAKAITDMVVRGAPAIGITAAYAVVLAARDRIRQSGDSWKQAIQKDLDDLASARPTAMNLRWAVERMRSLIGSIDDSLDSDSVSRLVNEAQRIHSSDIVANYRMGELGAALIESGSSVLTHCNAGALATGGYGTALGVIRSACAADRIQSIYASETRPWLQGSRLTAWELVQEGLAVTLIADSAAAQLMQSGKLQWIIVGSDRIAANGDVANKIGTYSLAVLARYHRIRFMVVAPTSTIDLSTESGAGIPIENRPLDEVLTCNGQPVAASGANALNPAFDVTPAELVDVIVTEKGVVESPNTAKITQLFDGR